MKVAFVPPRYGAEVVGGAEFAVRMFAEHLVEAGHEAEVFTSAARDATTWADELPTGSSVEGGVAVHRFAVESGRVPDFDEWGRPVLADPRRQSAATVDEWLRRQGPVVPDAVDAAVASDADALISYPYLYWPTVATVRAAPERSVVHPAAHDEPMLRLPVFGEVLSSARGLVFQTRSEQHLVDRVHPVAHVPRLVLGLGVTEHEPAADAATELGVDGPFLLCLGRVDPGKGTDALARFFAAYKGRNPGPLRLVLAGPVVGAPPAHPEIVVPGVVDEDVKWGLLRDAVALVSPSGFEAFSLVVLEAMASSTPVLVNRRCGATTEHALDSGAGIPYDDYATFEVALDRLLADLGVASDLGAAGVRYVGERFRWPVVVDRYVRFLSRVL
ncbi:MAG: glycosyltransferase family 4 protein [Actinomycetota bacterium]